MNRKSKRSTCTSDAMPAFQALDFKWHTRESGNAHGPQTFCKRPGEPSPTRFNNQKKTKKEFRRFDSRGKVHAAQPRTLLKSMTSTNTHFTGKPYESGREMLYRCLVGQSKAPISPLQSAISSKARSLRPASSPGYQPAPWGRETIDTFQIKEQRVTCQYATKQPAE